MHAQNPTKTPRATLVVRKYGGSSVATPEKIRGVADRVAAAHEAGQQIVVVVSAMGGRTDALVQLGIEVSSSPNRRELDALLSTGEAVSTALLAMALHDRGVDAVSMRSWQAGIETLGAHGQARIADIDASAIRGELDAGRVVVVAGYQGVNDDGDITTLGRGGSDYTAVALAHALEADRCEIYSDVEGVWSADPRVVPAAAPIAELDYDEMLEFARQGAKVLNTAAMREARERHVVVHARSTFGGSRETIVGPIGMSGRVAGVAGRARVFRLTVAPSERDALIRTHELIGERQLESGRWDLFLVLAEGTDLDELREEHEVAGPHASVSIVGSATAKAGVSRAQARLIDEHRRDFVRALARASVAPIDSFTTKLAHTFLVASASQAHALRAVHAEFVEVARRAPISERPHA